MPISSPSRRAMLATILAGLPAPAWAQRSLLDQGGDFLKQIPGAPSGPSTAAPATAARQGTAGANLSQGEIGTGLKDALKVASQRVVGRVGKTDGFNGDPAIRIPLPGPLQSIQGPLASLGAGGMLDDLQLRMNRAAEQAAPKALDIFTGAIAKMSIDDARGILTGPQDAATQYFKRTTSSSLTTSFRPIVDKSLAGAGAVGVFKGVQAKAAGIPLAGPAVQNFNLTDFTVGKALDGLFHYLGVEEAAIRTNPVARTTDLLKRVFG